MRGLFFVEGADRRKGGIGIVGVPNIAMGLAERGHQIALMVGGSASPGTEGRVCPDMAAALAREAGLGHFGIVECRCLAGRWAFSPTMFRVCWSHVRDADFITLHSLYSFPVLTGYLLARWFRKPYALWPHGVLAPFQRRISRRRKELYDCLVGRAILNGCSVLVYTSLGERAETRPLHLKAPSVIVPHGIEAAAFRHLPPRGGFRSRYLAGSSSPLVLFLSRINAKKGLDILACAFAMVLKRLPDARLAIVGSFDPPEFRHQVLNWFKEARVFDSLVMPGVLTGQAKLEALADADVFVLPSWAENFGFAVFEAMASGLPVLVCDTLNYADEIQSRRAGMSVPRDPRLFADALIRLLTDEKLRYTLGQNGCDLVLKYSWQTNAEKVERAICSIVRGEPLPSDLVVDQA